MICLIASNIQFAKKWARGQNLRDNEWFYAQTIFDIYRFKGEFHTLIVHEGIDLISNDQLNVLLTTAWSHGRPPRKENAGRKT